MAFNKYCSFQQLFLFSFNNNIHEPRMFCKYLNYNNQKQPVLLPITNFQLLCLKIKGNCSFNCVSLYFFFFLSCSIEFISLLLFICTCNFLFFILYFLSIYSSMNKFQRFSFPFYILYIILN